MFPFEQKPTIGTEIDDHERKTQQKEIQITSLNKKEEDLKRKSSLNIQIITPETECI